MNERPVSYTLISAVFLILTLAVTVGALFWNEHTSVYTESGQYKKSCAVDDCENDTVLLVHADGKSHYCAQHSAEGMAAYNAVYETEGSGGISLRSTLIIALIVIGLAMTALMAGEPGQRVYESVLMTVVFTVGGLLCHGKVVPFICAGICLAGAIIFITAFIRGSFGKKKNAE